MYDSIYSTFFLKKLFQRTLVGHLDLLKLRPATHNLFDAIQRLHVRVGEVVDDYNPARHYMAFVFVGYWLSTLPAEIVLWCWEIAGFIRYRGQWSPKDIVSGKIGIRHGRLVRRYGAPILPGLVAAELAEGQAARIEGRGSSG